MSKDIRQRKKKYMNFKFKLEHGERGLKIRAATREILSDSATEDLLSND